MHRLSVSIYISDKNIDKCKHLSDCVHSCVHIEDLNIN